MANSGEINKENELISNLDCSFNENIVCPYCGKEQSDSWERAGDNDGDTEETECDFCDKIFTVETNIDVTYTSWIREKKQ